MSLTACLFLGQMMTLQNWNKLFSEKLFPCIFPIHLCNVHTYNSIQPKEKGVVTLSMPLYTKHQMNLMNYWTSYTLFCHISGIGYASSAHYCQHFNRPSTISVILFILHTFPCLHYFLCNFKLKINHFR